MKSSSADQILWKRPLFGTLIGVRELGALAGGLRPRERALADGAGHGGAEASLPRRRPRGAGRRNRRQCASHADRSAIRRRFQPRQLRIFRRLPRPRHRPPRGSSRSPCRSRQRRSRRPARPRQQRLLPRADRLCPRLTPRRPSGLRRRTSSVCPRRLPSAPTAASVGPPRTRLTRSARSCAASPSAMGRIWCARPRSRSRSSDTRSSPVALKTAPPDALFAVSSGRTGWPRRPKSARNWSNNSPQRPERGTDEVRRGQQRARRVSEHGKPTPLPFAAYPAIDDCGRLPADRRGNCANVVPFHKRRPYHNNERATVSISAGGN